MDDAPVELLRDFGAWADRKSRDVDLMMLDEMLRLRSSYDDLAPSYWPAGSVEHLLLERLPAKGPVETFEPEVVAGTLDAYFKFMRSTGRMSLHSADPKVLTKEARRHARRMKELADDRSNWSQNKVLAEFGRGIGIDLEGAPDMETLQQRLEQIQQAWNALPVSERRRLMPHPDDGPDEEDDDLPGSQVAMRQHGTDDPITALLLTFTDRLPSGELPPPEQVATTFEKSGYLRQLLALAAWVSDGRAVTGTGVLRPALAKEVHDELGLGEWTRAQLRREYPDESLPGVAAVGLEVWIERQAERPWSRAADCEALHRLWMGAVASGLLHVSSGKALATRELPQGAEGWVSLGLRAVMGLLEHVLEAPYRAGAIVFALMTSYVDHGRLVTWDEIVAFHRSWLRTPSDQRALDGQDWFDSLDRAFVATALGLMADAGIYVESDEGVVLTDAGDVFLTAWLRYMQDR